MPRACTHELRGLQGAHLGAGDERSGRDARAHQEAAEPLRLTAALERQGPEVIVPVPRDRVPGVSVPDEMDGRKAACG